MAPKATASTSSATPAHQGRPSQAVRPEEPHAIWVFWEGPDRRFAGWYVNIQEPFRRSADGFDTQDLELDVWIPRGRAWQLKDDELLDLRVREGRFTQDQAREARSVYSIEQRKQVAATYLSTGSLRKTAEVTGVPLSTVHGWSHSD